MERGELETVQVRQVGQLFLLISQTALLFLSATSGTVRILPSAHAVVCSESERCDVYLVIRTHVSRVAPVG